MRKDQLVYEVADALHQADFEVSEVIPFGSYCFDIAARRDLVLILKILVNVDSIDAAQAEQLKRLCCLISAYPLLVGDRTRTETIEDDVVHERYDLPAINTHTLRMLIENAALPLIYGTKGGYYVRIDGDALHAERKRRGLSLGQLADMIGVSRESVYSYEHGGSASVDTAMALVEKLGVDLVEPVQLLRRIEMEIRPAWAIENVLLKHVVDRLSVLGFGVYRTPKTPFHALAREHQDQLLTTVFEHYGSLLRNVEVISSLSRVVDITAFMVSQEKEAQGNVRGIPIISEEELEGIERRSDLSGMIREKRTS